MDAGAESEDQDAGTTGDAGESAEGGLGGRPTPAGCGPGASNPVTSEWDGGACSLACGPNEACVVENGSQFCKCRFPTQGGRGCAATCATRVATGTACAAGTWTTLATFHPVPLYRAIEVTTAVGPDGGIAIGWGEESPSTWGTTFVYAERVAGTWTQPPSPWGPISTYSNSRKAMLRYGADGKLYALGTDGSTQYASGALLRRDGDAWTSYPEISALPATTHVRWQALAFSSTGAPLVAASENVSLGELDQKAFFHRWTGGGWQVAADGVGSGASTTQFIRPNLTVQNDAPLILFDQAGNLAAGLLDGGTWSDATAGLSPDAGGATMARTSQGADGRTFLSLIRNGEVFVYSWDGTGWASLGSLPCGTSQGKASAAAITADGSGSPAVVWTTTDGLVRGQWLSRSGWVELPLSGADGGVYRPTEITTSTAEDGDVLVGWIAPDGGSVAVGEIAP